MRVCFFINSRDNFNPQGGGVQRITRVVANELTNLGVVTYLLSMPNESEKITFDEREIALPNQKVDSKENILFIREFIEKEGIEVFINQDGFNSHTLNLLAKIQGSTKIISAHHNCILCLYERYPEIFKFGRDPKLTNIVNLFGLWGVIQFLFKIRQVYLWHRMLRLSNGAVLYFDSFKNELRSLTGITSDKIHVIPNPAPFDIIENKESFNKRIVYVGRIVENQKRIDRLMELWKRLHEDFDDWTFDLVGSGYYLEVAKDFAKKNNLERIYFHGMQNPLPYWDNGDIFTLTSDFEGYGMVLIEAQARGTVPITFNCFSAIGDVVERNKSGIVINDNNLDSMYYEVKKLMDNRNQLLAMRKAGYEQVKKFDKSKIANSWLDLFNSLK
jgi:glycosyltransferase involved in cell wall biosynthesis